MKVHRHALCFLVLLLCVRAETARQDPSNQQARPNQPPNRKNVQISSPLPFSQDLSTQPIGQQAYAAFQSGFPSAFGSFNTHNPNAPSFSVDPMISSGAVNLGNPQGGAGFRPMGGPSMMAPPMVRNVHSLTRYSDDNLAYGSSLTAGVFPKLRSKDHCELVQRQAVQVANNIVKRQNKVIFKELMDYVLKSKFLVGMTEVKLNRVLRRKFVALMKKYSVLSDDNVRLIQSEDEEILDDDLEDEDDDLSEHIDYQDPFKSNAIDIEEDNIDWRDVNNGGKSITQEDIDAMDRTPVVEPDQVPTQQPSQAEVEEEKKKKEEEEKKKKPWYKRIFDWKAERARQMRGTRQRRNLS